MAHRPGDIPNSTFAVGPFTIEPWDVDTFSLWSDPKRPVTARVRLLCGTEVSGVFSPCDCWPSPVVVATPEEHQS